MFITFFSSLGRIQLLCPCKLRQQYNTDFHSAGVMKSGIQCAITLWFSLFVDESSVWGQCREKINTAIKLKLLSSNWYWYPQSNNFPLHEFSKMHFSRVLVTCRMQDTIQDSVVQDLQISLGRTTTHHANLIEKETIFAFKMNTGINTLFAKWSWEQNVKGTRKHRPQ